MRQLPALALLLLLRFGESQEVGPLPPQRVPPALPGAPAKPPTPWPGLELQHMPPLPAQWSSLPGTQKFQICPRGEVENTGWGCGCRPKRVPQAVTG